MARATVILTCKECGKEFEYTQYFHNRAEADKWEEYAKGQMRLCPDCYRETKRKEEAKEKEELQSKITEWEKENNIPELYGSEKQIKWAREIRYNTRIWYRPNDDNLGKYKVKKIDTVEYMMKNCTNAAEWISGRENNAPHGYTAGLDMIRKWTGALEEAEMGVDYNSNEFARYPENCTKPGIVEISIDNNVVQAKYVKDDDFRSIIKSLGYTWEGQDQSWIRILSKFNGAPKDRAIELGNKLLNNGFGIRCKDISILDSAVNAEYEPEQNKWVAIRTTGEYNGWFIVKTPTEDLAEAAMRLPQKRKVYKDKYHQDKIEAVLVPANNYKEVLDFAELYGYSISDGAKKAINFEKEKTAVVQPKKAKHTEETGEEKLAEILKQGSDIIDDLRD